MAFSEIVTKASEVQEIKRPDTAGYKDIKPENGMNKKEAKEHWNKEFAEKTYVDDNGKEYRTGNELHPNTTYEVNGYTYKTDDMGRIISAEGKLQVQDHDDRKTITDSREVIGHGEMKATDDRAHLFSDRVNGKEDLSNIVPMDRNLNRGDYKKMENTLVDAVNAGADVRMKVEPVYDKNNDSYRPDSFRVSYSIDGEKEVIVFKNGDGGK